MGEILNKAIIIALCFLAISGLWADKYAGEIFRIDPGVRNNALGGCGITDTETFAPAFWNPALMALNSDTKFELMHAEEFMGLLKYDTISGVVNNVSFTLLRIAIDNVPVTRKITQEDSLSNSNRPYIHDSYTNADYLVYVGLMRKIGSLNFGFTPKVVYRQLAEESGYGFGLDLSTFIQPREWVLIGARLRDAVTTQVYWKNGTLDTVYPGLDLESRFHLSLPWIFKDTNVFTGIETYTESREVAATTSFGFLSLDYHAGLEIVLNENLSIYGGYNIADISAGFTMTISQLKLNYNFEQNTELDNSHRFSFGVTLP